MFLPGCDAILDSSIWGHARYVYVSNLCLLYLWLHMIDFMYMYNYKFILCLINFLHKLKYRMR